MPIAVHGLIITLLILAAPAIARGDASDRISRVVPIAAGGSVSVHITIGEVSVSGWERDELSVEIVRRAPDAPQLERIPATVEQTDAGVVVRAVQAGDGHDAALRTDVVLRLPAGVKIGELTVFEGRVELADLHASCSARVERGDIVARRLGGAIRFETAIGDIRLSDASLTADGLIRLRTFNGDVRLELARAPENARILALSMGGTVTSEIPLNLKDRWGPRFGETTLGTGAPVISIDVVNGHIAITVAGAGR